MRRFRLRRLVDETGISGIGVVAEGIVFSNGKCVLSWTTEFASIGIYDDIKMVEAIHGHDGTTVVEMIDDKVDRGF